MMIHRNMFNKTLILASLMLALPVAQAQQATELEIRKAIGDDEPRIAISINVPTDLAGLDFQTPLDVEQTVLRVVEDDTGHDLLAAHEARKAERAAQGWSSSNDEALRFSGMADPANNQGALLMIQLSAAPATGARTLKVKGTATFNFVDDSSTASAKLEGLPSEMPWDSPGVDTEIGKVIVKPGMNMTMDENRYMGFVVSSPDAPILSVTFLGEDVTAKVREMGMGVGQNEFYVLGEAPATLDVEVEYASTTQREVPFELEFGVGL